MDSNGDPTGAAWNNGDTHRRHTQETPARDIFQGDKQTLKFFPITSSDFTLPGEAKNVSRKQSATMVWRVGNPILPHSGDQGNLVSLLNLESDSTGNITTSKESGSATLILTLIKGQGRPPLPKLERRPIRSPILPQTINSIS